MREKLETLPVTELREMAKSQGIKGTSSMRKAELVDILCAHAEKNEKKEAAPKDPEPGPAQESAGVQETRASRETTARPSREHGGSYDGKTQANEARRSSRPYDKNGQSRPSQPRTYNNGYAQQPSAAAPAPATAVPAGEREESP